MTLTTSRYDTISVQIPVFTCEISWLEKAFLVLTLCLVQVWAPSHIITYDSCQEMDCLADLWRSKEVVSVGHPGKISSG